MRSKADAVKDFKKVIDNNYFTMDQELEMLYALLMKYNPMSISDLARIRGVSQPAISKQLKAGKIMYLQLGSIKLVIGEKLTNIQANK